MMIQLEEIFAVQSRVRYETRPGGTKLTCSGLQNFQNFPDNLLGCLTLLVVKNFPYIHSESLLLQFGFAVFSLPLCKSGLPDYLPVGVGRCCLGTMKLCHCKGPKCTNPVPSTSHTRWTLQPWADLLCSLNLLQFYNIFLVSRALNYMQCLNVV